MSTTIITVSPTVRALDAALATWDRHTVPGGFGEPGGVLWRLVDGPEIWTVQVGRADVSADVTATYHTRGATWCNTSQGADPAMLLAVLTALGLPEVAA